MSPQHDFATFVEQLDARVSDEIGNPDTDEAVVSPSQKALREQAFTDVVSGDLQELGELGDVTLCRLEMKYGARGRNLRVNGWMIDESQEQLEIVTTRVGESAERLSLTRSELQKVAKEAVVLADAARDDEFCRSVESASEELAYLHELIGVAKRLHVVVLVEGQAADVGDVTTESDGLDVRVDVWDEQRLFRAKSAELPYEAITIDIEQRLGNTLACLEMPRESSDYRVYLSIIPGQLLHDLYDEYGARLLELNVRSFLMLKGKVNQGIQETILKTPERFMAYNNGLCMTASEMDVTTLLDGGTGLRRVTGLQVVNGGQTVATIHKVRQLHKEKADLSRVFVQAKITVVDKEQITSLVPLVSRYANKQNSVNEADFSANSPYHVALEKLSQIVWCPGEKTRWFYERSRGQYQVAKAKEKALSPARGRAFDQETPVKQKLDKLQLARYVNTWDRLPDEVGKGGQKNFTLFTDRLAKAHSPEWEPDREYYMEVVAKAIIYREAEKIARQHKFPAYRANAVAYTVALVSYRTAGRIDLNAIWTAQAVTDDLRNVLTNWMPVVHEELVRSADGRNVTEWCKKKECWSRIQQLSPEMGTLETQLQDGEKLPTVGKKSGQAGTLSDEERENIARVMELTTEEWFAIMNQQGLEFWEVGIAATLLGYSRMGWNKVPSGKQAAKGVAMIQQYAAQD